MKSYNPQPIIKKSTQAIFKKSTQTDGIFEIDIFALFERTKWWEFVLNGKIDDDYRVDTYGFESVEALDNYVREKYAKELKRPEVIARILGNVNNVNDR